MVTHLELNSPLAPPLPLRRFSVEQYHRMGELGVLTPEDHVELLEGWIVEKMNQRPIHGFMVGLLNAWLHRELPANFCVRCQLPITTERSEPEPDLAVVRGSHSEFRDRHPSGSECRLVIEVADSSIDKDRSKAAIYRDAGVQEYWIINVNQRLVERFDFCQTCSEPTLVHVDTGLSIAVGPVTRTLDLRSLFEEC